ncbi:hypothetical protein MESS2_300057 [Mesorhizobium metallidurans STM 2683]|uniref:Uncharacterized protein n=1 Tax=Mesorhizobium metallidurans STM 2683 TaxID=1297569 RepID=M5ENP2_9HYPH|nr:hypothetical protein MESS2_300057 [Mesorhizobium metallidurans STM 2683]
MQVKISRTKESRIERAIQAAAAVDIVFSLHSTSAQRQHDQYLDVSSATELGRLAIGQSLKRCLYPTHFS